MVILLLMSAFFSGTETAYFSLNGMQQRRLRRSRSGTRAVSLLSDPGLLLSAILLGNTIINVTSAAIAASISADLIPGEEGLSLVLTVIGMTFLLLIFGEVSPKVIARAHAETWAARVSGIMTLHLRIVGPVASRLAGFVGFVLRLTGVRPSGESLSSDEIVALVELGRSEGLLGREAAATLSLLKLEESHCVQVMKPRAEVQVLRTGWTRERFRAVISGTGYTRYPLLDGMKEEVTGYIDAREYLVSSPGEALSVHSLPSFPENASLESVLKGLRASSEETGAVFDEYGDWVGMITTQDIVSYVLSSPISRPGVLPEGVVVFEGGVSVPASMKLEALSVLLDKEVTARWAETVGGLLEEVSGCIPEKEEVISAFGLQFKVDSREGQRLERIEVTSGEEKQ